MDIQKSIDTLSNKIDDNQKILNITKINTDNIKDYINNYYTQENGETISLGDYIDNKLNEIQKNTDTLNKENKNLNFRIENISDELIDHDKKSIIDLQIINKKVSDIKNDVYDIKNFINCDKNELNEYYDKLIKKNKLKPIKTK